VSGLEKEVRKTDTGALYEQWILSQILSLVKLVEIFRQLAANMNLSKFRKSSRGLKKPPGKRNKYSKHPHIFTARLLRKGKPNEYTRGVWHLGLSVRHICFMARRNDA